MPVLTITKNWADGETLDEADLDEIKNDVETFLNTTKLDATNLQDSAVTTAKIQDTAVTTSKVAATAITAAKLATDSVQTAKIVDDAVTTAKINDAAVTSAKLGDIAGEQISSDIDDSDGTGSWVAVTNASVSIDTEGRPVFVGLQADGDASAGWIGVAGVASSVEGQFRLKRDSTVIAVYSLKYAVGSSASHDIQVPMGAIWHVDSPADGTYTYTLEFNYVAGTLSGVEVKNANLIAFKLA